MVAKQVEVQSGRLFTEGDSLFYEVRGQGFPLLMIPPAGGDGWQYSFVAELLADEFKVITYDRRANGRSSMNTPQNFEISQHSRDAVAVLQAAGESAACVLGNSSGAVIALDMAKTQPQAMRAAIIHEAPLPRLLPDANAWLRFFASVQVNAYQFEASLAALQFMLGAKLPMLDMIKATRPINKHRAQSKDPYLSDKTATEVLTKMELFPVVNYLPDIELIKRNGVKMFVGISQWGAAHQAWYVEAGRLLAQQLGCELVVFPGHHGSFMDRPKEWAETVRGLLHRV